jgi:putative DNA methylase
MMMTQTDSSTVTDIPVIAPKKLIEVALPLDAINEASAKEKSIRHGHPSTLHLYWARRPLAAARAVIFAQMVNDPSWRWELEHPNEDPSPQQRAAWTKARRRLFDIIEQLVKWENTTNETVLEAARVEIRKSWRETCEVNASHPRAAELFNPNHLPGLHDPFAGGGAIPLEAQRLGLDAYASDLNPVAVLINKAMIEMPPRFADHPPVNPESRDASDTWSRTWKGAEGLAEDVRYYGRWMRDEAERRIGHLYPKITVTPEMAKERPDLKPYVGESLNVIAWLWARTVRSPNPAFSDVEVPLVSNFMLSTKEGNDAYIEPVVDGRGYRFTVRAGRPRDIERTKKGTKAARGANFVCVMSNAPIDGDYIKAEGQAKRMGARMMAIVAEGTRGRVYLPPVREHEMIANQVSPVWRPNITISGSTQYLGVKPYGMEQFAQLFTERQLVALTEFSGLIQIAHQRAYEDSLSAGLPDDASPDNTGKVGARARADAIAVYLSVALSRLADMCNSLCGWEVTKTQVRHLFTRQAIPMMWDFAENNVFGQAAGAYTVSLGNMAKAIERLPSFGSGSVVQEDARTQASSSGKVISTDPPYYDNVPYADLSDFFYVWLRPSLRTVLPSLFATLAVPKSEELVAFAYRHEGKKGAEEFFLYGMTQAMHRLAIEGHPSFPTTIYYAFRQSESDAVEGTSSAGWETFLDAVVKAGFAIVGTWPMRTELGNRMRGMGANALASSVVLVCRRRGDDASVASRREFARVLSRAIPKALQDMTTGADGWGSPVAPVDLSQAIIGPGMGIFTRFSAVLEADGSPMTVRTALQLINRYLADDDFDADTRFCLGWFEQFGFAAGAFGEAEVLAKAKGTSVDGVKSAGVVSSAGGRVQLTKWSDYPSDWDPSVDSRIPVWEVVHHLIRVLRQGGDAAAGRLLAQVQDKAGASRQLAYRLYTLSERAGRAEDARAYNELITSWPAIEAAMATSATLPLGNPTLFDDPA